MNFSDSQVKSIKELSNLIDELLSLLTIKCFDNKCQNLHKVKNILDTKDPRGMKNIKKYISLDFRMLEDNQIDDTEIRNKLNEVYKTASSDSIFF